MNRYPAYQFAASSNSCSIFPFFHVFRYKYPLQMARNNEEEDYKMQLYEVRADAILMKEEMDKMRREMDELRRRLGEQRRNDSLEGDLSIRVSSIEDQVKNAVAVLTRNIVSLQQSVRELSERGEETARNWRISTENCDRTSRQAEEGWEAKMEAVEIKIESMKDEIQEMKEMKFETTIEDLRKEIQDKMQNEKREQEELYQRVNNLVTENSDALRNKIDLISRKIDGMQRETSQLRSKIYPQILVVGGMEGIYNESSDIFLLDYSGKIWKKPSIELPQKVFGHGTVILDDELYIIGGIGVDREISITVYRLNKKMKWEKLADMHEGRQSITNSCISHNGCIWVIGGSSGFIPVNTIEKYDPATDRWERKPAMKRGRGEAAAAVINDRIYVCGGFDGKDLDSVEVFDISSEVWTDFCTLPQPRGGMSIIVDGTSIVLIGGNNEKTVWKMDVEGGNKEWIHLPPLNEGRSYSSAVMIEGCILVFGGYINDEPSCSVAIFSGQKWESFPPLPQPLCLHTSVVLSPAMIDAFRPFVLEK